MAVVMMSAVAVGLALLPDTALALGQLWTVGLAALGGGLLTLFGTVVQSSGEELLFRGWLLPTIGARYGPRIGVAVSSAFFSLAHGLNPNATALGLLNLSLFGTFLALYALAEGGLWGACAWHTLWNWTDNVLFGLRDSGGPPRPALLVSITPSGPDIVTGGAFGSSSHQTNSGFSTQRTTHCATRRIRNALRLKFHDASAALEDRAGCFYSTFSAIVAEDSIMADAHQSRREEYAS